jgi:hypothetical protein
VRLATLIRHELDWVVMKAMEKDRSRRYESVSALAADIKRYLAGDAVLAVPPSAGYRARKFIRRYRGPVVAGALVTLALVGGLIGTSAGFVNAQRQREVAEKEQTRAQREKERADENAAEARAAEELATRRAYAASVMSAATAISSVQYNTARAFLEGAPERLRGWEWGVLHAKLDSSIRGVATGDTAKSSDPANWSNLRMAPDRRSFFTHRLLAKETLKRWDLKTGQLLQTFDAPSDFEGSRVISYAAISPDGTRLSICPGFLERGHTAIPAQTWDLATGQRIASSALQTDASMGSHTAIFGDGSRMLVWITGQLSLCSLPGGNVISRCSTEGFPGVYAVFNADESLFTENSSLSPNELTVRRTSTLERVCVLKGHGGIIASAEFSPDSRWLGTAADDSTARVWDLSVSPPTFLVLPHEGSVTNIRFSPDGSSVATICKDHAIRVWDRATGALRATFVSDALVCEPLMFVSDGEGGSIVAGLDSDGTVRFWDVTAADTSVLRRHTTIVSGVRWARGNPADIVVTSSLDGHGQTFGVAGSNITVRIWDADSGEQVASLPGKLGDMTGCEAVSDDGRFAAFSTGDYDATLQVWSDAASETSGAVLGRTDVMDLSTGEKVFSAPNYRIVDWLCFAADQRSIVLADKSTSIQEKKVQLHLLDGRTGEQLRTRSLDKKCLWTFARGPDGRFIAAFPSKLYGSTPADRPNTMLLIDTQTLETIRELDGIDDGQLAIGFSPDGERIVTGGFDGKLHVYNAQTGAPLATMSGHRDNVLAIAFSPDGRRIASGGLDRKVRIWDAKTYDQLAAFSGHEGHINTLEWQPLPATAEYPAGDWRLFSSSGDSTARVWEPRPIRTRFEAREARKAALGRVEPMVTRLFEELKDASKVVERIKSDASLSPIDRKTALQVVLAKSLAAQAAVKH